MFLQGFKYASTLERVASERGSIRTKVLSFVVNSSILDLVEFLGLPLLNYKTTILHYLSRQTRPTRKTRAIAAGTKDTVSNTVFIKAT